MYALVVTFVKIVREGHIFDLKEIISDDLDKVLRAV